MTGGVRITGRSLLIEMPKQLLMIVIVASASLALEDARAQGGERSGGQIVNAQCIKCPQKGIGGAPKIGDREAWIPRLKNGLDPLVRSAINGHGGMPARGGLANLSDAEMRDAITSMFNQGRGPEKTVK